MCKLHPRCACSQSFFWDHVSEPGEISSTAPLYRGGDHFRHVVGVVFWGTSCYTLRKGIRKGSYFVQIPSARVSWRFWSLSSSALLDPHWPERELVYDHKTIWSDEHLSLPFVNGGHTRQDVDAGSQLARNQARGKGPRIRLNTLGKDFYRRL